MKRGGRSSTTMVAMAHWTPNPFTPTTSTWGGYGMLDTYPYYPQSSYTNTWPATSNTYDYTPPGFITRSPWSEPSGNPKNPLIPINMDLPTITRKPAHQPHSSTTPNPLWEKAKHGLIAGSVFLGGLLLNNLPRFQQPASRLISADWKDWAQIGLGVVGVNKINKALNIDPPPWVNAIETAAFIMPMALGFKKQTFLNFAVMAPFVALMVQATMWLGDKLGPYLEEKANVPPIATKLGLSVGMALVGLKAYPKVFEGVAKTGLLGKSLQNQSSATRQIVAGTEGMVCARGCCQGSVICLTEIGEFFGGMASGGVLSVKSSTTNKESHS